MNYTEYIKINLPDSEEKYRSGNGEGCFCLVTPEVKAAYDADENGTTYEGILDNDSVYYPGLNHGTLIPFEMRGSFRPVVPYTWLIEHYSQEAPLNGTYYLLDCLDGIIGDELITAAELSQRLYGEDRQLTEAQIKAIAADYEAELHRYIYVNGEETEHKQLTRLMW